MRWAQPRLSHGRVTAERPAPAGPGRTDDRSADHLSTLRDLAATGGSSVGPGNDTSPVISAYGLDAKTAALACLGALVALRAPAASFRHCVDRALAAGATADDVVDTLKVVAPSVGLPGVVSAVPRLALALGYDIDAALEAMDAPGADYVRRPRAVGEGEGG